jgi:hypothetical protein
MKIFFLTGRNYIRGATKNADEKLAAIPGF